MRSFLGGVEKTISGVIRWLIIALMLVMTATVFLQIVFRYVFNVPLAWSEELARFSFVWVSFFGASALMRMREHINVTVFTDNVPPRVRSACVILANLCVLFCIYFFVVGGVALATNEWSQLSPTMQVPMGYVYVAIPLAASLMGVWVLVQTIELVLKVRGEVRP